MQHHAISCNSDQSREDANQQQAPVQGGSIQLDLAKTPTIAYSLTFPSWRMRQAAKQPILTAA